MQKIKNWEFSYIFSPGPSLSKFLHFRLNLLTKEPVPKQLIMNKRLKFYFLDVKTSIEAFLNSTFFIFLPFFLVYSIVRNRSCHSAGSFVKILIKSEVILMLRSAANLAPQISHLKGLVPSWTDSTMYFEILQHKFCI